MMRLSTKSKRKLGDAMWALAPICFAAAFLIQSPGRLGWLIFGLVSFVGVSVVAVILARLLVPRDPR
jgi:hypothetical protein